VCELLEISAEPERVANIDKVTGLPNSAALDARLEQEMERAIRYRRSVSNCCVDVDSSKQVDDVLDDRTGDAAD
jgi:diguanylate cyclase (GGDEF)-like protein